MMRNINEANLLSTLGQRETQIFEMLSEGKKTSQIAETLSLKPNTVSTIKKVIYPQVITLKKAVKEVLT